MDKGTKLVLSFSIITLIITYLVGYISKYMNNLSLAITVLLGGIAVNYLAHSLIYRYLTKHNYAHLIRGVGQSSALKLVLSKKK